MATAARVDAKDVPTLRTSRMALIGISLLPAIAAARTRTVMPCWARSSAISHKGVLRVVLRVGRASGVGERGRWGAEGMLRNRRSLRSAVARARHVHAPALTPHACTRLQLGTQDAQHFSSMQQRRGSLVVRRRAERLVHVPFPTFSVVAQVLNHLVHILWAAA